MEVPQPQPNVTVLARWVLISREEEKASLVPLAPLRETDHRVGCGGSGGGLSNLIGSFFGRGPNYSVIESTVIRGERRVV